MEDEEEDILSVINNFTTFPTQQEQEVEEEEEVLNVVNNEEQSEEEAAAEAGELVGEIVNSEEDLLSSDPTNTVIENLDREGSDITFSEFNNTPEDKLQEILESKYGNWLEFDEPIIYNNSLRGANLDVIQITNPQTGDTKDYMNL
jgi:vacuolar-type H+-ATPase subunit I/STV1